MEGNNSIETFVYHNFTQFPLLLQIRHISVLNQHTNVPNNFIYAKQMNLLLRLKFFM